MSLKLYFHPLSSFCQKPLVALYENDTPFTPQIVNLFDEADAAALRKLWPIGKFPLLRDDATQRTVPESSIIIEYLAQDYPGKTRLVPADPDIASRMRLRDRFYDLYVNVPMQNLGSVNKVGQHHRRDCPVILNQVALRVTMLRPEDLVEVGQDKLVVRSKVRGHRCPKQDNCQDL